MAYNVTDINTTYVDENKVELLTNMVLAAPSLDLFHKVPNIKGPFTLNTMANAITFQSAKSCGFSADGTTTYSQRTLSPVALKVNMEWCHKDLLSTFAEYDVNITAGQEEIAHEQRLMEDISARIANSLETMIWQGTASTTSFDGIYAILNAASTTNKVSFTSLTKMTEKVNAVYMKIGADKLDKTNIYMNRGDFRQYVMELTENNMFHYAPTVDNSWEVVIPGTTTKVIALPGVATGKIIALIPEEVFYGFDAEEGYSVLDFWYSKDNDTFRLNVQFMAGVQVAFPENTVLGE